MTLDDIIKYQQMGLSTENIALLMQAEANAISTPQQQIQPVQQVQQVQPVQQVQQVQPVQPVQQVQPVQPVQPVQTVQQVQPVQPVQTALTFEQQLQQIGQSLQQSTQPVPPATTAVQPNLTPANAGITPEEATKLFQAWSMGAATQSVELPPSATDVLNQRFNSLYGVDTTKQNTK